MPFNLAERFINAAEDTLAAALPYFYRQARMASNGGEICAYNDVWNLHALIASVCRALATIFCARPA
jgi:hypothetical protein